MKGISAEYYLGTIVGVPDSSINFNVIANIPGVIENIVCYPLRCSNDEPKIGDLILIRDLDPEYHSYFVYEKLNENNFTGMRCKGKIIDFTDESLKLGIFDEGDFKDHEHPDSTSWIELDEEGHLDIVTEDDIYIETGGSLIGQVTEDLKFKVEQDAKIDIGGHTTIDLRNGEEVTVTGDVNFHINGNYSLTVGGELNIDAASINISGGKLKLNTPDAMRIKPFNSLCACMYTGVPHGTDEIILSR